MPKYWWRRGDGERNGPCDGQDLCARARDGRLLPDDLVCRDGDMQWVQAAAVRQLREQFHAHRAESLAPTARLQPWIRVLARAVDEVLFAAASMTAFVVIGLMWFISRGITIQEMDPADIGVDQQIALPLAVMAASALVEASFLTLWGATPGKFLCGVRVRNTAGHLPSPGAALGRAFLIPILAKALGFLPAAAILSVLAFQRLRSGRKTLWDDLAGTVIEVKAVSPARYSVAIALVLLAALAGTMLIVISLLAGA